MNLETHHLGQISAQVPNQAGTTLPGLPQQNGNPVTSQMQNHNIHHSSQSTDPEILKGRGYMREKIWEFIMHRHQTSQELSRQKMYDVVSRLEVGLFRSAPTKEDYLNMATLESRLHALIRSKNNQQFSRANASPTIGTMIPTPGFQQTGNSSVVGTSAVDSSVVPINSSNATASPTVSSGNGSLLPGRYRSSGSVHGALAGGYQQSSPAFSINTRVNNTVTSMSAQRTSQMIPTPGINYSNNNDLNINANHTRTNVDLSNNGGACPGDESTGVSQLMLQKQHLGGQNSRILHNIGGHMGGGIRSTLQQKSFGLSNGPLNGGLGMLGKNMPVMNGPGITEGHLTGDGYGIGAADASGSGNLYAPVTSVGLMMNNQSLNTGSMQSMATTTAPLNNHSNVYSSQQVTTLEPQLTDQPENMHFQSQYSVKENLVPPHQHQQFQHPSYQFQSQEMAQHRSEQEMQLEDQLLVKNDSLGQSQLLSHTVSEPMHQLQVSSPFHFSEMQNEFQKNTLEDHSGATRVLPHTSGPQDVSSSGPL